MNKDWKSMLIHLGMMFSAVVLLYKVPHSSLTVGEAIIMPIRQNGSIFYLSNTLAFILIMLGVIGFINNKKFANRNRFLLFILSISIILPFMNWTIDVTRSNYYWIKQEKLKAVDVAESNLRVSNINNETTKLSVELTLKDYSRRSNEFKIRVYLPEALSKATGTKVCELTNVVRTSGDRRKVNIVEEIEFTTKEKMGPLDSEWYYEEIKYELYNEEEIVTYIDHQL